MVEAGDDNDDVEEGGGERRVDMDASEEEEDEKVERQLISNDGRVARTVRVQRRYAEKMSQEQQGRRDDL